MSFIPQLETYITFGVQPNLYVYIYSPYRKMWKKKILRGKKANNTFGFDIVNALGKLNVNNNTI